MTARFHAGLPLLAAALLLAACENPFGTSTTTGGGGGTSGPSAAESTGEVSPSEPPGISTADSLILDSDVTVEHTTPEWKADWDVSTSARVAYYSRRGDGRIKLSWSQPPAWWHPNKAITIRMTSSVEAEPVGPFGTDIRSWMVGAGAVEGANDVKTPYTGRGADGNVYKGGSVTATYTLKPTNAGTPQKLLIGLAYGPTITYLYKP